MVLNLKDFSVNYKLCNTNYKVKVTTHDDICYNVNWLAGLCLLANLCLAFSVMTVVTGMFLISRPPYHGESVSDLKGLHEGIA